MVLRQLFDFAKRVRGYVSVVRFVFAFNVLRKLVNVSRKRKKCNPLSNIEHLHGVNYPLDGACVLQKRTRDCGHCIL